jgi:hypothetical protein
VVGTVAIVARVGGVYLHRAALCHLGFIWRLIRSADRPRDARAASANDAARRAGGDAVAAGWCRAGEAK